jgi:hypothetical protein
MEDRAMRNTTLPTHPFLTHPRTGDPLTAVGVLRGRPVWPVIGASPDDPSNEPAPDSEPPATGDPQPDEDKLGDPGKAALKKEREEKRAAEKRASEAEAKLRAIEDKDKSELEIATARVAELERDLSKTSAELAQLRVAVEYGVSQDDMILLTGSDEATLRAQAERLKGRAEAAKPPTFAPNPGQGTPPASSGKPDVNAGRALYEQRKNAKT